MIAGLGLTAGVAPRLGALAVGYVLFTVTLGSAAARLVDLRSPSRADPDLEAPRGSPPDSG